MSQNDSSDIVQKWRGGVELSFAWHAFADAHQLQSFSEAPTLDAQTMRRIMMVVALWAKLDEGDLLAFGHRVCPAVSDGPVLIPAHTFESRPPIGTGDTDEIEISGWRYERVRVCPNDHPVSEPEPNDTEPPTLDVAEAIKPPSPAAGGGGRYNTYEKSRTVLAALYAVESNRRLSAAKLHPAFVAEFSRQYPRDAYSLDPPCDTTLRKQINRYRQELTETDNNRIVI